MSVRQYNILLLLVLCLIVSYLDIYAITNNEELYDFHKEINEKCISFRFRLSIGF